MKKFERLPPEARKEEIRAAALELFRQKGFAATTMENIVGQVSLSKGGVYRIYPSTTAILADLMIAGGRLRNAYYAQMAEQQIQQGGVIDQAFLIRMIGDSLLLYREYSEVYVEFLWEKRRNPELEACYQRICQISIRETGELIRQYGAEELLGREQMLENLTNLMNAAILSIHTLNLWQDYEACREKLAEAVQIILR